MAQSGANLAYLLAVPGCVVAVIGLFRIIRAKIKDRRNEAVALILDQNKLPYSNVCLIHPSGEKRCSDGEGIARIPRSWLVVRVRARNAFSGKDLGVHKLQYDDDGWIVLELAR